MKFNFKIQQYQTDAVENTVSVFEGQPLVDGGELYRMDKGRGVFVYEGDDNAYRNHDIAPGLLKKVAVNSNAPLLDNIRNAQKSCDITLSSTLASGFGACNLDIDMETGTGKTYVYIKTMFELNKRYGWTKFIIVVPSVAIREGVFKSFETLEEHFMFYYQKKARYFIYDSKNLTKLDSYSSSAEINVMIINFQAFATSMKEGGTSKESKIMYSERDEFQSRRPIDVIAANRPIIIMDEPQRMEGAATQNALRKFNPLFTLYYSATHRTNHNTVYALDSLDAYNQKLVKKIQVKAFKVENLQGKDSYMYIDDIKISPKEPPMVKINLEVDGKNGIKRETRLFKKGDKLAEESGLRQYEGFEITDIIPEKSCVVFMNGSVLRKGDVIGDTDEESIQRVQIRETIKSHFEKEKSLFEQGIKTLSLFFIDEVAHYKSYDENGETVPGKFWKIFEEEYASELDNNLTLFADEPYQKYLRRFSVDQIHNGYFSIDKKGRAINSKEDSAEAISAYDLILKNKERLLDFNEPTRFIFSHSALSEGWDNPNVFQICTLRHAGSDTRRRQEIGRGLRLCVDQNGERMDYERLGERVHEVNKLTVIANESYADFVSGFQSEIKDALRERATKPTVQFFVGKSVRLEDGTVHLIDEQEAESIKSYLFENDYIDKDNNLLDSYKAAAETGEFEPMGKKLRPYADQIHQIIKSIFDENAALAGMIEDGNKTAVRENTLNANFEKKEFIDLWKEINHKYAYTVSYDSDELINNAIKSIDDNLTIRKMRYTTTVVDQKSGAGEFGDMKTSTQDLKSAGGSNVKYDLVGEIAKGANLTRRTVVKILKGMDSNKLLYFKENPEDFIHNAIKLIREQKATMIIESISYNQIEGCYESSIFTAEKHSQPIESAYHKENTKHILDYVFTDSDTERKFAEQLEAAEEVVVYAKLPRSLQIPTPVGNYAPDWAIAFKKGSVKHIFFIAETKGTLEKMQLKPVELTKINCARKVFNEACSSQVRYSLVTSYKDLLEEMDKLK